MGNKKAPFMAAAKSIFFINTQCLLINLTIKPTSMAAIIVPSLTPANELVKTIDITPAITARETSNATFETPNSV